MSTPIKRKITLELNPNKKVLPKDRPSVFQRLGTKKFPPAASASGSGSGKQHQEQESILNKEEIVKRIVGCEEPEPVPPPVIVPDSVSAHARLIEAQLAAKLGKVIVSRGETIGAVDPVLSTGGSSGGIPSRNETERGGGHSSAAASERERPSGAGKSGGPAGGGGGSGGGGWDQSSLENADQDILERKRKELQHELKLEMDASGGGSSHHHHHHHSSSSVMKQKVAKETLVVKKIRKVPAPRRSSSSSDSSSSSGSDSSDSDSSSSSSSSSRDSRRVKKRTIRQRRDSSSSSDGGGGKKIIKKHVKKVSADGTKRIVTKKIGGHLTTKIRVKKVTSPGGTSHIRKVAREISPGGKAPTKYTVKKIVAVKKDKHAVVVDARERVREKERELALREKEREREKERLRHREREREQREQREPVVKSRSPRPQHIRSRSPRSRISPAIVAAVSRGRELKKKSPEVSRYREPVAPVVRRPERSPERIDDRRRHETLKDRERRERQERELARNKEREEALARCQERQRERERLAAAAVAAKERPVERRSAAPVRDGDGGLEKPDRHRPVERLLPRPADRARALAAARSPGKPDHGSRSRTPNSPRSRERIVPREASYDRGAVERGYVDHHDRRSRSREREYVAPVVRAPRARDSPYERHPATVPARETRDYRDNDRNYERERRGHDYARTEYPDDPPPRRDHEREWEREREPDRGPPQRTYERREEHGREWERDHGPPAHSHNHDQEPPYQGSSRNWDESHWKEADGWVNDKERADWKYKERQWEHDDHPAVGPPSHSHTHGTGGRRWQPGHPEPNQGSNWHGKPKEDLDFVPRHKLAGRLGDSGGSDRGMFRRHHQGHQPMFHHGRKPHIGMGPGRFGGPNKYSINRTQQNLAAQHQHPHPQQQGPPLGPANQQQQQGGSQPDVPPVVPNAQQQTSAPPASEIKEEILPTAEQTAPGPPEGASTTKLADEPSGQPAPAAALADDAAPAVIAAEGGEPVNTSVSSEPAAIVAATAATAAAVEKAPEPVPELMDEDNLSEISDDPDDILTREEDDDFNDPALSAGDANGQATGFSSSSSTATSATATFSSSSMMVPSQVLQNHSHQQQQQSLLPRRPFLSKARYKSYDGCIGGPVGPLPDLYGSMNDGGSSFRVGSGEISQLNESTNADKLAAGDPSGSNDLAKISSDEALANASQQEKGSEGPGSTIVSAQELKDAKEAGKLHANKELKEEMDLDFEEISDGELEEENKFKGLGDALGVDWASLAHETRAKLKPEQTIPVSARNRWKAHHILLDIGISVRLAGEAYAQRVLTESKEKLREEIEEFKAAAVAVEQQKVAAVKKEQEEQQLFNGVKIKKEVLDEDEQEAQKEPEPEAPAVKKEDPEGVSAATEQETSLAEMDKILHPVASVHVAMRERARARRNLILRAAGPYSRALSARRDLEIRRQLCGFPPQECNERITEHQAAATNPELHETVMKMFQAAMQAKKIEVQ